MTTVATTAGTQAAAKPVRRVRSFRNTGNTILTTGFAAIILALFLMPFVYMIFTSLKTADQITVLGTPIWPAAIPSYTYKGGNDNVYTFKVHKGGMLVDQTITMSDYVGQQLDIFTVPLANGTKKNMALLYGLQSDAVFMDPKNPSAAPVLYSGGYYKALPRPWIFSPTWSNYSLVWTTINFPRLLGNTMFYAFTTTIGVLISCILTAFGFSRFRFPGRDFLFIVLISMMFLPYTVTIIPTFTFFTKIGWVGSWLPLIVPSFFANPYDTFLLRQFFMTLPRELDEAAMIDGASPFRVLWSVIIPQSYAAILAVTVFHIVWAWNDYFGPLIYLASKIDSQPVSVALARFNSMYSNQPYLIQAGALMTLLIPLIIFFLAQRFFVQGIVITGVEK